MRDTELSVVSRLRPKRARMQRLYSNFDLGLEEDTSDKTKTIDSSLCWDCGRDSYVNDPAVDSKPMCATCLRHFKIFGLSWPHRRLGMLGKDKILSYSKVSSLLLLLFSSLSLSLSLSFSF